MEKVVMDQSSEVKENVIAGIVGAFLFSLAGAAVYVLLNMVGYIASISGLVGAVCAVKGYSVFSKKESKKGIVIAAIISVLVIVLAWYFCMAYDLYDAYKSFYEAGETDFYYTFGEAVQVAPLFLTEPEIARAYLGDLALSLLFCLLGCGSYVFNKLRNANGKNGGQIRVEVAEPAPEQTEQASEDVQDAQTEESTAERSEETVEESHVDH